MIGWLWSELFFSAASEKLRNLLTVDAVEAFRCRWGIVLQPFPRELLTRNRI